MAYFSERLPHVVTRADLATLLTPTSAAAQSVDDEEAHDRLTRAVSEPELLEDLYWGLSEALAAQKGPRTDPESLMDKLSKRVQERKGRLAAAEVTPEIAAALVRINLLIGLAPDTMRAVLASAKGKAALDKGLRALGAHLVRELLK
ncbi:MAG: hypothetical protein HY901_17815 [Deltaproteobacteria bacterium]|nr:hypothetical protein [Deltaproteobacteria bacterium]